MLTVEEDIKLIKELIEAILNEYKRTITIMEILNQRIGELEDGASKRTNRPH